MIYLLTDVRGPQGRAGRFHVLGRPIWDPAETLIDPGQKSEGENSQLDREKVLNRVN